MATVPEGFTQVQVPAVVERWALECEECGWTTSSYSPGFYDGALSQAHDHDLEHLQDAALREGLR